MPERSHGRDRSRTEVAPKVAVLDFVRETAERTTIFDDPGKMHALESVLVTTPHTRMLGSRLVELLGVGDSRVLVAGVREHATLVMKKNSSRRDAAEKAIKWANRTEPGIRDDGWHDPVQISPRSRPLNDVWGRRL